MLMENNDDCWDLFAVVRSCRAANRSAAPPAPPLPEPMFHSSSEDLTDASHLELEKLWNPFFSISQQPNPTPLPCSSSAASAAAQPRFIKQPRPLSHTMPRLKKRKNQQKRDVREVPADGVAADVWAWRKYGQKPIKGSLYPRGYYRCSSSKGCLARKQVERSRTDPGMFVITYTGEHNHPLPSHRNSLAGTTRQKLPVAGAAGEQGNSSESSALTATAGGLSPNSPLAVSMEEELLLKKTGEKSAKKEEEGMLLVEDMEVMGEDEVLFMGAEPPLTSAVDTSDAVAAFFSGGCSDGLEDDFLQFMVRRQ